MSQSPAPAPRKPANWWRFNLRTLLILAPLAAIVLGLGIRWYYPRYLERRAVEEIERLGGTVVRNDDSGHVIGVELPGKDIDDAKLRALLPHLKNLPQLRDLVLASNQISDEGLLLLAELPQLEFLYVADTKVTDAGVAKLQSVRGSLTIDRISPHGKARSLARRDIFEHAILRLALSPDGSQILAGAGDGHLRIFDLATRDMVASHPVHAEWAFSVVFQPDGRLLATGGGDGLVKLWNWPAMTEAGRFVGHTDDVHAVGITPDGRRLVSAGDDMVVRIWDVATRRELFCLGGHDGTIPGLAISADGTLAATASRDGTVRLWLIERGECVGILEGHTDDVMSVAFHPSGRELASASYDGTVRVWRDEGSGFGVQGSGANTGVPITVSQDWVFSVAYSPSGDELIAAAGDGVRAFDYQSRRLLWKSSEQKNVSHALWLNADEVASASADASISVWQSSSGDAVACLWTRFTPQFTDRTRQVAE
jgi:WD40 repeat protein